MLTFGSLLSAKIRPFDTVPVGPPNVSACNIARDDDIAADAHPVAGRAPSTSIAVPETAVHIKPWL